jgi:hypothetical protein
VPCRLDLAGTLDSAFGRVKAPADLTKPTVAMGTAANASARGL